MPLSKASFRQLQRFSASDLGAMLEGGDLVVYVDSQAKFRVSRHDGNGSHADSQATPKLEKEGVKRASCLAPSDSQAKKEALQALIASMESKPQPDSQAEHIPWYNPADHVVGRPVRMKDASGKNRVVITPECDADGRPLWE